MWKVVKSEKIDLLEKAQKNLEEIQNNLMVSQENTRLLVERLSANTEQGKLNNAVEQKERKTEEEKLRAAYALNLCTVSVSQIVDYDDIRNMEMEYNAILNNLNLEMMPKDEALLRILKQLLDVITFFRMQEGDRKMMEKEYQQRMKDAVWSAIPNPSMIVAGGNPVGILVSLASQVGIGYMNYRKEKARIGREKEKEEWELQRSAMEQFNGLRRELFDTAWRLAEEYEFPDEYRITENQITQYNAILLDPDDLRRYERLRYIKERFKAYPPFWYHIGNAANAVYQNGGYAEEIREKYKKRAIKHFDTFFEKTEKNLLREDQLVASCALEKFDLIENKEEQLMLLKRAEEYAGNSLDVLQLCALSYLKIGKTKEASNLMRMLVNEGYNMSVNAQILSKIYILGFREAEKNENDKEKEKCRNRYDVLKSRIGEIGVFPFVEKDKMDETFLEQQKKLLKERYARGLKLFVAKGENEYRRICDTLEGTIERDMASFLQDMAEGVKVLCGEYHKTRFLQKVREKTVTPGFQNMIEMRNATERASNSLEFSFIFRDSFMYLVEEIKKSINNAENMEGVSRIESCLYSFLIKNELHDNKYEGAHIGITEDEKFAMKMFGPGVIEKIEKSKKVENCLKAFNELEDPIITSSRKGYRLYKNGEHFFNQLLEENKGVYYNRRIETDSIVAIMIQKNPCVEIVFTTDMLQMVFPKIPDLGLKDFYGKVEVDIEGKRIIFSNGGSHSIEKGIDSDNLNKLIKKLAKLRDVDTERGGTSLASQIYTAMFL